CEPPCTDEPAGLLVGRRREQDVTAQSRDRIAGRITAGGASLGREQPDDLQLHRQEVLHVDGAAAVEPAVVDFAREWVVRPALRRRGHDVEMREEQQGLTTRPVPGILHLNHRAHGSSAAGPRTTPSAVVSRATLTERSSDAAPSFRWAFARASWRENGVEGGASTGAGGSWGRLASSQAISSST